MRCTAVILVMLICAAGASACLVPEINQRAVQWSTAIVQAKLLAEGSPVPLGQLQERQGARGALGIATIDYSYRIYTFEVTGSLDGPYKKSDKIEVVRLLENTTNPPGFCSQHLSKQGVGKEFLLLLRPLSGFMLVLPNSVKKPDVKDGMVIVHLAAMNELKPDALTNLMADIADVRTSEKRIKTQQVQQQIDAALTAADDPHAEPAIRALVRMGPKVLSQVQAAADKATANPQGQSRLYRVVGELSAPDPLVKITTHQQPGGFDRTQ